MAESIPSARNRGEVDTSKPYADVKEAISRFDHLPGLKNSAEKRGYESPIGALKEQLAVAMAARDKAEMDKTEIEQELVRLRETYEQVGRKLDAGLATPSIPRADLQKLYEEAMADLEESRNRIQELEAGRVAAKTGDDHKVDGESTARSLSKEMEQAEDREGESMHRAEDLRREVERLQEELRRANEEVERLKSSGSRAMEGLGETAAETTRVEAAIKDVEEEKTTLLAMKRYLEPELESTKMEQEALQRDRAGDEEQEEDHAAAAEKIKAEIEAARSSESKTAETVAAVMEGYEQVAAEAVEAEVVRAGVMEEVSRMKAEAAEIKAGTTVTEQRIQELYEEAKVAKESEAAAMESILKLDDDDDPHGFVDEETKRRLGEAREEEEMARKREEELRKKLEAARAEIESTRTDLKQANDKAASAEAAKAAVEGELRRWRSDNEQRRRMAMVANLTAATPVPQRNGDTTVVPAQMLVANVSSMDRHRLDGNGNGRRFSSGSRDHVEGLVLPPRPSAFEEQHGRRSSGESLAQVLQIKMPDAGKSRNQEQIVVETATEIKKKKIKFLARLGAMFTPRKKRS